LDWQGEEGVSKKRAVAVRYAVDRLERRKSFQGFHF
jgi:hypothetical protein